MGDWTLGLMSGTSMDGVDGVLARFDRGEVRLGATAHHPMPAALRQRFLALQEPGANELHLAAVAAAELSAVYAAVVREVLRQAAAQGIEHHQIQGIGAHGQTVRHQPNHPGAGYSLQLLDAARLVEDTGLTVVTHFRSRDIAAGGQGAPLVPAFHQQVFAEADRDVAVLNLGGIANLTLLPAGAAPVRGFDCGPANVLLDAWCQQHTGQNWDVDGRWADQGRIHRPLLDALLREPYFDLPPPKSTGRDLFNMVWLQRHLDGHRNLAAVDVQATLLALTVQSTAQALMRHAPHTQRLVVCGGGAFNRALMQSLRQALPGVQVESSQTRGLPPQWVEAAAFAWLARQTLQGKPGNLPSVTGARGLRVLGAVYPA